MPVAYLYPSATPWANHQLLSLYKRLDCASRGCSLVNRIPYRSKVPHVTYGYLGYYSNLRKQNIPHNSSFSNLYILDHAYVPSSLKGSVFRLCSGNSDLTPFVTHDSLLSSIDLDFTFNHLCQLQSASEISFSVPSLQSFDGTSRIALFIKSSPVISRLLASKFLGSVSFWKSHLHPDLTPLLSVKPTEVVLSPFFTTKSRIHQVIKKTFNYDQFEFVYSPSSMMAIPFILHSIPVYLSTAHPLFPILGSYIPPLSRKQSIELIINAISRTSISISMFSDLEALLSVIHPH